MVSAMREMKDSGIEWASKIPLDWDEYDFAAYAKVAGANNPNCVQGFGYTTSELNKME